jgi:hypothetical protein
VPDNYGNRTVPIRSVAPAFGEQTGETSYLLRPIVLSAMFLQPQYLGPSAWLEHIPFAFWLIEAHQPRIVVELGTHYGTSYFALCQAVQHLGLDTECYAVDHWNGDEHTGFYGEDVFEKVKEYNDVHYSTFSRLVRSSFADAVSHFSDKSVDLLHIDGVHRFEAVQRDFESWLPRLSDQALVLIHHSNVRESNFGVFRLVEQLREYYPLFEFVHGHGLTVVAVGTKQSDLVARLFHAPDDRYFRYVVREVFGRLGRSCADAYVARSHQARLSELESVAGRQKQETEALRQHLEKSNADLVAASDELRVALLKTRQRAKQHAAARGELAMRANLLHELRLEHAANLARIDACFTAKPLELRPEIAALSPLQLGTRERTREDEANLQKALLAAREDATQLTKELEHTKAEFAARVQELSDALTSARQEAANGLAAREQLRQEVELARAETERLEAQSIVARQAATAGLEAHKREIALLQKELEARKAEALEQRAEKGLETRKAEAEKQALEQQLKERFDEIAALTRLFRKARAEGDGLRRAVAALLDPGGKKTGAMGLVRKANLRKKAVLLQRAGFFDSNWYLGRYKDVADAGVNPLHHYIEYGAREGREPNACLAEATSEALNAGPRNT